MKKITSAYANKWLKSLEEDKEYWVNKEEASSTYVAAINEEPVIPEYDYAEVAATIAEIDEKIAVIKHALNVTNATAKVQVKDTGMSVDTILIKMAQLNKRKAVLDRMRKQLPTIDLKRIGQNGDCRFAHSSSADSGASKSNSTACVSCCTCCNCCADND